MALINDLRDRLMGRKPHKPVSVTGTQAERLAEQLERPVAPPPPRQEAVSLEHARAELEKLLGEIDSRLGAQQAETERLIKPIEGVPVAVEAITEVKGQCGRMLEMITSQVEGSRGQEEALASRLQDASAEQGEVLATIRSQLETNTQAIRRSAESYEGVTESVNEVLKACCKLQELLGSMAAAGENESGEVAQVLARSEKTFKLLAIAAGAAAGVALIVAVIGLFT